MYFLLKMGIFHCYVSLPEGILNPIELLLRALGVIAIRRRFLAVPESYR